MSFTDILTLVGTALVVAVCFYIINNPVDFEAAPVVIQVAPLPTIINCEVVIEAAPVVIQVTPLLPKIKVLPEPQAAQLVASPSVKKRNRVEEHVGSSVVAPSSPEKKRKTFVRSSSPSVSEKKPTYRRPSRQTPEVTISLASVAGAQLLESIQSAIPPPVDIVPTEVASACAEISEVVSVEVEMVDAPMVSQLKSCFKSSSNRFAKRVRFVGPSNDCIHGQIATYVVEKNMESFRERHAGDRSMPHESFPLIEEMDQHGNPTGWFSKRDSFFYPPEEQSRFGRCKEHTLCRQCRESVIEGFCDPEVDFSDDVLESDDPNALLNHVHRDQYSRYNCILHGGN
ncbi:uncharacterized protein EAF01_007083 [Botrytis porri]|uniref:uncharacterized protein n=1 Tax=Botrytis porri TaxID=87229 RepID=UPI0018FFC50A|nr:uncharacterized protein EAF01_007083 [Botrytis porri]KAF7901784.1 hypothetical protein EAF01_007083 [Botrytis porri]